MRPSFRLSRRRQEGGVLLAIYTAANRLLGQRAWDPYPFILLNLFLSMLAALQAPSS